MVATAASMRAPKRRASSPSSGHRGVPKVTVVRVRRRPVAPLGKDVAGPVQVHRHHRPAGPGGQVGGPPAEGLGPSVGGSAPLGEDHQVPLVGQQARSQVGRTPVDLGPFDGDGGQEEGPRIGLPPAVEEVVGGRGHHGAVAEPQREAGQEQRRVDVAGVVGREDHRRLELGECLLAPDQRARRPAWPAAGSRCRAPWPGPAGPGTGGTRRCRSRHRARLRRAAGGPSRASSGRPRGTGLARPGTPGRRGTGGAGMGRGRGRAPESGAEGRRRPTARRGRRELAEPVVASLDVGHQDRRRVEVGQRRGGPTTSWAISRASARVEAGGTRAGARRAGRRRR